MEYEIPRFAGVRSDKLRGKNEDISGIRLGRRATIIFNNTKTAAVDAKVPLAPLAWLSGEV